MKRSDLVNSSSTSKYSRAERAYFALLLGAVILVSVVINLIFQTL